MYIYRNLLIFLLNHECSKVCYPVMGMLELTIYLVNIYKRENVHLKKIDDSVFKFLVGGGGGEKEGNGGCILNNKMTASTRNKTHEKLK